MCLFLESQESAPQKNVLPQNYQSKTKKTCWALLESKDQLISYILLWTSSHGHTCVGWPAKIYIYQLCADTTCNVEDWLSGTMTDRHGWRKRIKGLHFIYIYIYIYMCVCVCVCDQITYWIIALTIREKMQVIRR